MLKKELKKKIKINKIILCIIIKNIFNIIKNNFMENSKLNENSNKNNNSNSTLITPKNIFNSITRKVLKCSKTTIKLSTNIIEAILSQDKEELNKLSEQGLPDDLPILRALVWKINLGYLPLNSNLWEKTFIEKRNLYKLYKDMIIQQIKREREEKNYKKKQIIEQILKDISRTGPTFSFFFQSTDKNKQFTQEELVKMYKERKDCVFQNIEEYYNYILILHQKFLIIKE